MLSIFTLFLLATSGISPASCLAGAGRSDSHAPSRRHAPLKRSHGRPEASDGVRFHRQRRAKHRPSSNNAILASQPSICTPSFDNLTSLDAWTSLTTGGTPYAMVPGGGVKLFLQRPSSPATDVGGENDVLGSGATLNSSATLLYGRITYDIAVSAPAGVVAAAILMGTASGDEIDIELLPAHPTTFQTNVFKPAPTDAGPLFGVFAQVPTLGANASTVKTDTVAGRHQYTIDWNPEAVTWSVDGVVRRTLAKADTTYESSFEHFPSAVTRPQIGIWDASAPAGTASWAGGPINWSAFSGAPSMTVYSVEIECPY